jgi:hypothetical protein
VAVRFPRGERHEPEAVESRNWPGYADDHSKGAKYSMVTGKWTEPTGKCGTAQSLAVF